MTVSVDSNRVGGSKRVSFNSELDQRAAYTHEAQITVHLAQGARFVLYTKITNFQSEISTPTKTKGKTKYDYFYD